MKKALILTVWDAPNYGSFLQAVATKKYLEENGYNVKFIKYRTNFEEIKFLFEKKKQLLFHPIFSIKRAMEFINEHKNVDKIDLKKINKDDYDLIVIGSDEIWNLRNDKFFAKDYFYGQGFETKKTIVYSVSIGTGRYEDFFEKKALLNNIHKLDGRITVRDLSTYDFLNNVGLKKKIPITCDPTFLIDQENYIKEYRKRLPNNYIIVYSYKICENLKNNILKFARANNLKIISLCNYYDFCDYNICCSPLEFSDIIKKAKFCVITTFHGTIFSIFNHQRFVSATNKQKTVDILTKLDLQNQIIDENSNYDDFVRTIEKEIDYKKIDSKILEMRKSSIEWLNTKLEE